jgi:hypothetical protein
MSSAPTAPRRLTIRHGRPAWVTSVLAMTALGGVLVSGCSAGPSTKDAVCTSFNDLGTQLVQGNGLFGNPVFHKAGDLGDLASRYPARDLSANAAALKNIANSDSTSGQELMSATDQIADLCGHPLAMNVLGP